MGQMFENAKAFNQPLNKWDVSPSAQIESIFDGSFGRWTELHTITQDSIKRAVNLWCSDNTAATTTYGEDISVWDVSRVSDMSDLFKDENHNQAFD